MSGTWRTLVWLAVLAAAAPAAGEDYQTGTLAIAQPWARASLTPNGAVYLTVVNRGKAVDRLDGVSTPVADKAELHGHTMENGIMRMRALDGVALPPGKATALQPSGLHIMLIGLRHPLKEGERFPLTLGFERAGKLEVEVRVESAASMGPGKP